MSVWLTLFFSVLGTGLFFGVLYGLVLGILAKRRFEAKPRLGVAPGDQSGTLGFWLNWDPTFYALQIYRLRVTHSSPNRKNKEGQFSVTYDPPQKAPFLQLVKLPEEFREILEDKNETKGSVIDLEARTVENIVIWIGFRLEKIRSIYQGKSEKIPSISAKLKVATPDPPSVASIDYGELVERKKKLKELEAQAKAKEQKATGAAQAAVKAAAPAVGAPSQQAAATPPVSAPMGGKPQPAVKPALGGQFQGVTKPAVSVTPTTPAKTAALVEKPVLQQDQPLSKKAEPEPTKKVDNT